MGFSLNRFLAILMKEFIQMRRDRMTFAMMIAIPIMQLMLFASPLIQTQDTCPLWWKSMRVDHLHGGSSRQWKRLPISMSKEL